MMFLLCCATSFIYLHVPQFLIPFASTCIFVLHVTQCVAARAYFECFPMYTIFFYFANESVCFSFYVQLYIFLCVLFIFVRLKI